MTGPSMQKDLEGKVRKNPASRLFAPLADVYRKNGKVDEAVSLLEQGLALHPNYGSARVLLARCREDLGEWDRAREAWLNVLEGDPGSLVAFRGLAEIAVWTGDRVEAVRWFRRYLEEFPGDERVRARLAEILTEPAGEERLSAEPTVEAGTVEEAPPRHAAGEPEPATDEGAPPATGSDSLETMTLAEIYAQQGFYERAVEIYRRIERQAPGNGQIRERIRVLEARLSVAGRESGGRTPDADADEEAEGLSDSPEAEGGRGVEAPTGSISINAAGSSELESIPGVGPVIARKIVVERERNGPFSDGQDMCRVPSLGRRLIERIEPYLTFDEILRDEDASSGESGAEVVSPRAQLAGNAGDVDPPEAAAPAEDEEAGEDVEFEEFRRWLKNLRR